MTDQPTLEGIEEVKSFPAVVWDTLSKIDVGDYIETKGDRVKLSFLSWTYAWMQLMNHFPESEYVVLDEEKFEDGTMATKVHVTVRRGSDGVSRLMWLPVMDHRNNSIENPSSRQVSDTRMRCLVKCLALFGLGLDVYAGSDMPVGQMEEPLSDDQAEMIQGLLEKSGSDEKKFLAWLGADSVAEIPVKRYKSALAQLERAVKKASQS